MITDAQIMAIDLLSVSAKGRGAEEIQQVGTPGGWDHHERTVYPAQTVSAPTLS